jgi:hypothetical protein
MKRQKLIPFPDLNPFLLTPVIVMMIVKLLTKSLRKNMAENPVSTSTVMTMSVQIALEIKEIQ